MTAKPIAIDLIRTDGGTQMRAELDKDVYLDYRDKWLAGVEFPAVDLFHDGTDYWLADGFQRYFGAKEAKRASLPANVHQGTQRDAVLFATGANSAHGLRRSNADKRKAVETLLNDPEWVTWSDNKVAEQAAVSQVFVSAIRKELITVISSPAAQTAESPKIGKDGKKRAPRKGSGKPRKPKEKQIPPTDTAPPVEREPGEDETETEHVTMPEQPPQKPVTAQTAAKNGNATVVKPPFDATAIVKQFEALARAVDDMARSVSLNNSPHHREVTGYLSKGLDAFNALTKDGLGVWNRSRK